MKRLTGFALTALPLTAFAHVEAGDNTMHLLTAPHHLPLVVALFLVGVAGFWFYTRRRDKSHKV